MPSMCQLVGARLRCRNNDTPQYRHVSLGTEATPKVDVCCHNGFVIQGAAELPRNITIYGTSPTIFIPARL